MKKIDIFWPTALLLIVIVMNSLPLHADIMEPPYTPDQVVVKDGIRYVCQNGEAYVCECIKEQPRIVIPSKVMLRGKPYPVTSIGNCAFCRFDKENGVPTHPVIETVVLPPTVREIGHAAFGGCKRLKSIVFSENVEVIGRSAFERCNSLESIELPPRLKKMEEWLFFQCECLKNVVVPASVEEIDKDAFYQCKKLETVTLLNPDTYIRIGWVRHSPNVKVIGGGRVKYR